MVLPAISIDMVLAPPQIPLPSAKSARAPKSAGRRPNIWAMPPLMGRNAVEERAYAEPTHTKSVAWRSCAIVGRVVDTAVSSRAERKRATHMERKMSQKTMPFFFPGVAETFRLSSTFILG